MALGDHHKDKHVGLVGAPEQSRLVQQDIDDRGSGHGAEKGNVETRVYASFADRQKLGYLSARVAPRFRPMARMAAMLRAVLRRFSLPSVRASSMVQGR